MLVHVWVRRSQYMLIFYDGLKKQHRHFYSENDRCELEGLSRKVSSQFFINKNECIAHFQASSFMCIVSIEWKRISSGQYITKKKKDRLHTYQRMKEWEVFVYCRNADISQKVIHLPSSSKGSLKNICLFQILFDKNKIEILFIYGASETKTFSTVY